jgi:hypothetical protein
VQVDGSHHNHRSRTCGNSTRHSRIKSWLVACRNLKRTNVSTSVVRTGVPRIPECARVRQLVAVQCKSTKNTTGVCSVSRCTPSHTRQPARIEGASPQHWHGARTHRGFRGPYGPTSISSSSSSLSLLPSVIRRRLLVYEVGVPQHHRQSDPISSTESIDVLASAACEAYMNMGGHVRGRGHVAQCVGRSAQLMALGPVTALPPRRHHNHPGPTTTHVWKKDEEYVRQEQVQTTAEQVWVR